MSSEHSVPVACSLSSDAQPVPSTSAAVQGVVPPQDQQPRPTQGVQPGKSRRREFKAVYLTAAFVLPLPVMWLPFEVARVALAAGFVQTEFLNLLEIGGGIAIFYNCVDWLTFVAVSKSFRRAYREMWEKVRTKCSTSQ